MKLCTVRWWGPFVANYGHSVVLTVEIFWYKTRTFTQYVKALEPDVEKVVANVCAFCSPLMLEQWLLLKHVVKNPYMNWERSTYIYSDNLQAPPVSHRWDISKSITPKLSKSLWNEFSFLLPLFYIQIITSFHLQQSFHTNELQMLMILAVQAILEIVHSKLIHLVIKIALVNFRTQFCSLNSSRLHFL